METLLLMLMIGQLAAIPTPFARTLALILALTLAANIAASLCLNYVRQTFRPHTTPGDNQEPSLA